MHTCLKHRELGQKKKKRKGKNICNKATVNTDNPSKKLYPCHCFLYHVDLGNVQVNILCYTLVSLLPDSARRPPCARDAAGVLDTGQTQSSPFAWEGKDVGKGIAPCRQWGKTRVRIAITAKRKLDRGCACIQSLDMRARREYASPPLSETIWRSYPGPVKIPLNVWRRTLQLTALQLNWAVR